MKNNLTSFLKLSLREMWEHKASALYFPVGLVVVFLILQLLMHVVGPAAGSAFHSGQGPWAAGTTQLMFFGAAVRSAVVMVTGIILLCSFVVSIAYALGCLYLDRKDRSILFWKSLPISETNQYFSKLFFSGVLIPLIAILAVVILIVASTFMSVSFFSISESYTWLESWSAVGVGPILLYFSALFPVMLVTGLPLLTWMMLASAWSKKSPGAIALVVPLLVVVVERIVLGSNVSSEFIKDAGRLYIFDNVWSLINPEYWKENSNWGQFSLFVPNITQVSKMILLMAMCVPAAIWLRNRRFEI